MNIRELQALIPHAAALVCTGAVVGAASGQIAPQLVPQSAWSQPGRPMKLELRDSEGRSLPWPSERVAFGSVTGGGTRTNLHIWPNAAGDRSASFAIMPEHGGVRIALDLQPRVESTTLDQLALRASTCGMVFDPPRWARERGTVRVRLVESCAAVVRVADGTTERWPSPVVTQKSGHAIEVRPLSDPTIALAGSDILFRAYVEGDGLSGEAFTVREPLDRIAGNAGIGCTLPTSDKGIASLRIDRAGAWVVEVAHVQWKPGRDAAAGEYDCTIYAGSLWFEVPMDVERPGGDRAPSVPSSRPAPGQWEPLGPAPLSWFGGSSGRISAIVCSPTDQNKYYVAGADGGVWRTNDGGASWTPITDAEATTAVGALAMDPTDENTLYAGTGEGNFANHSRYGLGLLKTTNGGDTWQLLASEVFAGRCFSQIAINPQQPSVLYAGVTRAGGFPEMAAAKGHPQRLGPLGLFKSENAGVSWSHVAGGLPAQTCTAVVLNPAQPSTVFAAIGHIFGDPGNGIYRSLDAGATWTRLTTGLPATHGRASLAISPSSPDVLVALMSNVASASGGSASNIGGFRSENGGQSWATFGGVNQATYGWYLNAAALHPTDHRIAFFGGLDMDRVVAPGAPVVGGTITPPHVDVHAITFDAAGRLVVGDDGGVHRSTNLGNSWINMNDGLGTVQFYAGLSVGSSNENLVLGGTQDNGSNLRTATGLTWTTVTGGDGGWTQIDPNNQSIMFTESQGTGAINRSTNGGASFNNYGNGLSGRNAFLPPYLIDPSNTQRLIYGTERVWQRDSPASSWQTISPDLSKGQGAIRALAIAPTNPMFVYAATNDGNVARTTNGGANWTIVLTDNPGWPRVTRELAVHPQEPATVYLAGAVRGAPKVRRSVDAGSTWLDISGDLPDVPVNVVAVDARTSPPTLFAGMDEGVRYSTDDGAAWRSLGQGMPRVPVIDAIVDVQRERLVVGTQGRGAWQMSLLQPCLADCDANHTLNIFDYICFSDRYAQQDPYADCDKSGTFTIFDYICFSNAYSAGCP